LSSVSPVANHHAETCSAVLGAGAVVGAGVTGTVVAEPAVCGEVEVDPELATLSPTTKTTTRPAQKYHLLPIGFFCLRMAAGI